MPIMNVHYYNDFLFFFVELRVVSSLLKAVGYDLLVYYKGVVICYYTVKVTG